MKKLYISSVGNSSETAELGIHHLTEEEAVQLSHEINAAFASYAKATLPDNHPFAVTSTYSPINEYSLYLRVTKTPDWRNELTAFMQSEGFITIFTARNHSLQEIADLTRQARRYLAKCAAQPAENSLFLRPMGFGYNEINFIIEPGPQSACAYTQKVVNEMATAITLFCERVNQNQSEEDKINITIEVINASSFWQKLYKLEENEDLPLVSISIKPSAKHTYSIVDLLDSKEISKVLLANGFSDLSIQHTIAECDSASYGCTSTAPAEEPEEKKAQAATNTEKHSSNESKQSPILQALSMLNIHTEIAKNQTSSTEIKQQAVSAPRPS